MTMIAESALSHNVLITSNRYLTWRSKEHKEGSEVLNQSKLHSARDLREGNQPHIRNEQRIVRHTQKGFKQRQQLMPMRSTPNREVEYKQYVQWNK